MYREQQEIRYWELEHFNNEQIEPCKLYEQFIEELEEDPVIRSNVKLHKLKQEDVKMKKLEDRITEISPNFEI